MSADGFIPWRHLPSAGDDCGTPVLIAGALLFGAGTAVALGLIAVGIARRVGRRA